MMRGLMVRTFYIVLLALKVLSKVHSQLTVRIH